MIDFQLYSKIKDYHENRKLAVPQIARELQLDERTVAKWLDADKFRQREITPRSSKLDPFKPSRPLAGDASVHRDANLSAPARSGF